MKILPFLLALTLLGCQAATPPQATPVPPAPTTVASEEKGWFTYFAPDGKYSLRFPKAPETVAATPAVLMLAYPLDKKGSNLSFVSSKLEKELTLKDLVKNTTAKFGKSISVVKNEEASWGPYQGVKLEMEMKGTRVWVHMILAKPYLYQLLALQSAGASEDHSRERQEYFSSFQFTQK